MHGGDIYRNKIEYDFSVNVNPYGIAPAVKKALRDSLFQVTHYPDPFCLKLRKKIAKKNKLKKEQVLCGNGASELILATAWTYRPKRALLLAPCFLGYEIALRSAGIKWDYLTLSSKEEFQITEKTVVQIKEWILRNGQEKGILFLTNPNNPTGVITDKKVLKQILELCTDTKIKVLLDECFLELTKERKQSLIEEIAEFPNLLILRAFTKSFALAGIRLGYLLGQEKELEKISRHLSEWNISIPAQEAGIAALTEGEYLKRCVQKIEKERKYLQEELTKLGCLVFASKANYILFYKEGIPLYEELLKQGILIRDCSDYEGLGKGYYRVAVRKHAENKKLTEVLKEVIKRMEIDGRD